MVENDIFIYMHMKLKEVVDDNIILNQLVKKAEGLFQWAFVACDYIANPPPPFNSDECLESLLYALQANGIAEGLDKSDLLYTMVLKAHFNMAYDRICRKFRSIMTQVLSTFEPLSIMSLNALCQQMAHGVKPSTTHKGTAVFDVVKHTGSLLSNIIPSSSVLLIAPLHTSFYDFLTDKT